ncbi:hypothetical protein RSAG8_11371, partial [Rhizoctonia solani AG-8 WAC10335]
MSTCVEFHIKHRLAHHILVTALVVYALSYPPCSYPTFYPDLAYLELFTERFVRLRLQHCIPR